MADRLPPDWDTFRAEQDPWRNDPRDWEVYAEVPLPPFVREILDWRERNVREIMEGFERRLTRWAEDHLIGAPELPDGVRVTEDGTYLVDFKVGLPGTPIQSLAQYEAIFGLPPGARHSYLAATVGRYGGIYSVTREPYRRWDPRGWPILGRAAWWIYHRWTEPNPWEES